MSVIHVFRVCVCVRVWYMRSECVCGLCLEREEKGVCSGCMCVEQ